MLKAEIRKTFLSRRLNLSKSEYWSLTDELIDQLSLYDWSKHQVVHVFLPISRTREVDTFSILLYFKEHYPSLSVTIPRTNFENRSMENVLYDHDYTILRRNKYDIPEPLHGRLIDPLEIDLVFTPLLAFDQRGNRVGYGKGFYDRFFTSCRVDVIKTGLSYFGPVDLIEDVHPLDVKLDYCICPARTWDFTRGDAAEI